MRFVNTHTHTHMYIILYIDVLDYTRGYIRVQIRGGVVQMVLVDTERNAQGAQLQNASACTFFQLQNEEHNSFWLGK